MHIVFVEIENFRGIKIMSWAPRKGLNCLIGPGDSAKTTILDAIELALNPRSSFYAVDYDFYGLNISDDIRITVTMGGLPEEFKAESRYGLYLRGWCASKQTLMDEPGAELEDVLSIRLTIDKSLEARWSIYNLRIEQQEEDNEPPAIRYKDAQLFRTARLGPYADRHFAWGRQSVLSRLDDTSGNVVTRLADVSRAAQAAFGLGESDSFTEISARVQELGRVFSVPVRDKYRAQLDIQSVNISTGGISLHDGNLPLRCLGTGSSRLLASAMQKEACGSKQIALFDEVEYGLEPHRVARLLRHLRRCGEGGMTGDEGQTFLTSHSPVVIRELSVDDLFVVRADSGVIHVSSVNTGTLDAGRMQAYLRSVPEAFLARKVLVCEGKTECGLVRGLDDCWVNEANQDSFALLGIAIVDGGGKDKAPQVANALLSLGYDVALLLDSDKPPNAEALAQARQGGAVIIQWAGKHSTEERMFSDLPWPAIEKLISLAVESKGEQSVVDCINNRQSGEQMKFADWSSLLLEKNDSSDFRILLGATAKAYGWYKDISWGERLAKITYAALADIKCKPLSDGISQLRRWVDDRI